MQRVLRRFKLPFAVLCTINVLVAFLLLQNSMTSSTVRRASEMAKSPLMAGRIPPKIRSVHLAEFAYVHWPEPCGSERDVQPLLLGATVTAPGNITVRRMLRRLYMSLTEQRGFGLRWVFIIGSSPNVTQQSIVDYEAEQFGDIVQLSYIDSYENLTLKVLSAIDWAAVGCPCAQFFLKIDTDTMVNPFRLVEFLTSKSLAESQLMYSGFVPNWMTPIRSSKLTRWHMNVKDYPLTKFPPYAAGGGYLLSRAALLKVLAASDATYPVRLEDVYIGMCAMRAGLAVSHLPRLFVMSPYGKHNYSNWCTYREALVMHYAEPTDMPAMWRHMTAPVELNPDCGSSVDVQD